MPRIPRMLINEEPTVYHVISRTALDGFPLGDIEKDYLVELIKNFNRVYFVETIGYCIMGNHFHLLVKMLPDSNFSDEEIKSRFLKLYGEEREFVEGQIPFFRNKWSNLSEYLKDIKQTFSRFYNKQHNRRGFFWGDRFKSVIVEKGETLINCLAYIDLNPVRAGIVERPEEYRWNSIGYHIQSDNKNNFLSLDFGLKEFGVNEIERLKHYRKYVYEVGALKPQKGAPIDQEILEKERKNDFELTKIKKFKYKTRYFTDSGIIGSKSYVKKKYQKFKNYFQSKQDKRPVSISGLNGIYSLKRLTE